MIVTKTLLIYQGEASDGSPHLYAVDKASGEQLGKVEVPEVSSYGMMTYVHDGRQYIMLQTASKLTAMALAE
jgi:quinoprotein glucose dehydrogenase